MEGGQTSLASGAMRPRATWTDPHHLITQPLAITMLTVLHLVDPIRCFLGYMMVMRYCLFLSILPSITRIVALTPPSLFVTRRGACLNGDGMIPRLPRLLFASDDSISSSSKEADGPIVDRDEHVRILNDSLERHIGKGLRDFTDTSCDEPDCWDDIHTSTRYALHSHGAKNDLDGPVNNYGNFGALGAFEMTFPQFTRIPAGRVANPGLDQEEWSQVLQRVQAMKKEGFLQSYKGFRCTVNQISFFIKDAMVWNCFNDEGDYYGQAVFFDREKVTVMDAPPSGRD